MQKQIHPEAFTRTLLTIRLRSSWTVSTDSKFIRIISQDNSVHILKSDVTGYGLDEPEDRTCVFVLTRGALYRIFTGSNSDAPLLLRTVHQRLSESQMSVREFKKGVDALLEEG